MLIQSLDFYRRDLHHGDLLNADDSAKLVWHSIQLGRDIAADRCGGGDGLYGSAASTSHFAPV